MKDLSNFKLKLAHMEFVVPVIEPLLREFDKIQRDVNAETKSLSHFLLTNKMARAIYALYEEERPTLETDWQKLMATAEDVEEVGVRVQHFFEHSFVQVIRFVTSLRPSPSEPKATQSNSTATPSGTGSNLNSPTASSSEGK